jgi:putative DNA primase/helicase
MPDADASTSPTAAVNARVLAESGTTKPTAPPAASSDFTDEELMEAAELGGDIGPGILYAKIARNKVVLPAGSEMPLIFTGNFWERDIKGWHRTELLNREGQAFVKKVASFTDPKQLPSCLLKTKNRFMSGKGQHSILEAAFKGIPNALTEDPTTFNQHNHLLAFNNCVCNLKTGATSQGFPEQLITKHVPHDHPGNVTPVEWQKFLLDIFGGDIEIVDFLQRFFGYALTGTCSEQKFMIMTGLGGNGKGTLLNVLSYVLGEYCVEIPAATVIEQRTPAGAHQASPHLMMLQGARLAVTPEVPKKKLDVSAIKWLASNDPITARGMNQNFITFTPTHTLIMPCNDLPTPPASDRGFWRRALVLTFPFLYVDGEPQAKNEKRVVLGLEARLKAEAPAIAAWLVKGAIQYAKHGLKVPASIKDAVEMYRSGNDYIGRFITDACCTTSECRSKLLYDGFRRWYANEINAEKGCPAISTFTEQMEKRFDRIHKKDGNYYIGIGLNSEYFNALG